MVQRQTPWVGAVTERPESFGFAQNGRTLVVSSGRSLCRLNLDTSLIVQSINGSPETSVRAYSLTHPRWTSVEPPIIDAHPFFLLHLFATGQVDTEELMARALRGAASGTTRTILSMQRRSELHRMLGREQFGLRLMTTSQLHTAQD
ncbi:MAG TPA: hypothetical protein VJM46_01235 [Candidatus Saccharimonadales bacterium]|nr:hypothetical protein [Candidatus Saccharimonadales bacterium]